MPLPAKPPPGPPPPPDFNQPTFPEGEPEPILSFPLIEGAARDLQARRVLSLPDYERLDRQAKATAFTVAHVNSLETLGRIQRLIQEDVTTGGTLRGFQEAVGEMLDSSPLAPHHIENVYRTNIAQAFKEAQKEILSHPLVEDEFPYVAYEGIHDSRRRPEHKWFQTGGIGGSNIYRADDPTIIKFWFPWGFSCFVPETKVQGTFVKGFRLHYRGQIREIVTRHGNRLRVTANHPIFTMQGCVGAASLHKGDYVISYHGGCKNRQTANSFFAKAGMPFKSRFAAVAEHEQHQPTSIEQAFRAFSLLGHIARVPIGHDDFHGDAMFSQGQVEIVRAKRELMGNLKPTFLQASSNFPFAPMDENLISESSLGHGVPDGFGNLGAGSSSPSRSALPFHGGAIGFQGGPLQVLRIGAAAELHASRFEMGGQGDARDAAFIANLLQRFSTQVFLDEIVQVRDYQFDEHVYDLQSPYGWIVAEGILASNCRCLMIPLSLEDTARRGIQEAIKWQETGQPPAQPAWVAHPPFDLPAGWR